MQRTPVESPLATAHRAASPPESARVAHRTIDVDGVEVFYREAGRADRPSILLLHGFPSSSHMFRNLMPALADEFHLVAPDYPGFGFSAAPDPSRFAYTFDHLADVMEAFVDRVGIERHALYVQDYGAPIGFRLAARRPQRVTGLIIQNGNAYEEGLDNPFWEPLKAHWRAPSAATASALRGFLTLDATRWQYLHGARDAAAISPATWTLDHALLSRPGNDEIQLALFRDYGNNVGRYPEWHAYFREHRPPALVVWGENDTIFPAAGAIPYARDLDRLELHLLDAGHFALEEVGDEIAALMRTFLRTHVRG